MLSVLAPAVAAALCLLAVLIWQQSAFAGRKDMAAGLVAGAAFFLYKAFPAELSFCLPVVLAGPLMCNRAHRAGFEVGQRPVWLDVILLAGLLIAGGLAFGGARLAVATQVLNLLSLYLFLELPFVLLRGLPDDLVEARRNARLWVLGLGAGLGAAIAAGAIIGRSPLAVSVGAAATLALSFAAALFGRRIVASIAPVPAEAPASALDGREEQVLRRLRQLMAGDVYTDAGLTLSKLAQKLDVPEHRLRRVIHAGEGRRNFSAWLNAHRIAAFKRFAEDPAHDDETILSLALAVGYSSLSVFNRAFKETEGMTPSAYRLALNAARTANTSPSTMNSPEADKAATAP